jgi:hypothetical protein
LDLPSIDTHHEQVNASAADTWEALVAWAGSGWSNSANARFARLLGCESVNASGEPGTVGSTIPGFRVASSEPPRMLGLAGGHHFSTYTLDFRIEDRGETGSLLSATTHAAFPGLKGELYKTAVIRSRAHVLATKRILRTVARRAERARI